MVVRLGIVEDDSLLRLTLTELLSTHDDLRVVSSFATGEDIVRHAGRGTVDAALLDVHLGDGPTGFDVAATLRELLPRIGIVFLSSVKDPRLLGYRPASVPRGARYVLKSEATSIDWLAREIIAATSDISGQRELPAIPFTETQIEILRLVAAGYSNAAIAKERFVTEGSVEIAVSRLAKHLGLRDMPGANRRVHIAKTFFREMGWPS